MDASLPQRRKWSKISICEGTHLCRHGRCNGPAHDLVHALSHRDVERLFPAFKTSLVGDLYETNRSIFKIQAGLLHSQVSAAQRARRSALRIEHDTAKTPAALSAPPYSAVFAQNQRLGGRAHASSKPRRQSSAWAPALTCKGKRLVCGAAGLHPALAVLLLRLVDAPAADALVLACNPGLISSVFLHLRHPVLTLHQGQPGNSITSFSARLPGLSPSTAQLREAAEAAEKQAASFAAMGLDYAAKSLKSAAEEARQKAREKEAATEASTPAALAAQAKEAAARSTLAATKAEAAARAALLASTCRQPQPRLELLPLLPLPPLLLQRWWQPLCPLHRTAVPTVGFW